MKRSWSDIYDLLKNSLRDLSVGAADVRYKAMGKPPARDMVSSLKWLEELLDNVRWAVRELEKPDARIVRDCQFYSEVDRMSGLKNYPWDGLWKKDELVRIEYTLSPNGTRCVKVNNDKHSGYVLWDDLEDLENENSD